MASSNSINKPKIGTEVVSLDLPHGFVSSHEFVFIKHGFVKLISWIVTKIWNEITMHMIIVAILALRFLIKFRFPASTPISIITISKCSFLDYANYVKFPSTNSVERIRQ